MSRKWLPVLRGWILRRQTPRLVVESFDEDWYVKAYPDVAVAGSDPFVHYINFGWLESRQPNPDFNTAFYRMQYLPGDNTTEPLAHYLIIGRSHGFSQNLEEYIRQIVSRDFDAAYYLHENADVAASGMDPLSHFLTSGWSQRRKPNSNFETGFYLEDNPDVANSGLNPFFHYLVYGRSEGRYGNPAAAGRTGSYHFQIKGLNPNGTVAAKRIIDEKDFSILVPFKWKHRVLIRKVAAFIHVYYTDILPEICNYLVNIPCVTDLFISTDTEEKRQAIEMILSEYRGGKVEIRVLPNRGRDIAPKIIGFSEIYPQYEFFLHLHTKKSVHLDEAAPDWRRYLLDSLLGNAAIVGSIFELLAHRDVGLVCAQHMPTVRSMLNWGYDFDLASGLLRKVGVKLDRTMELEFPSGSMFWGRSEALKSLLDLKLSFDDFPEEDGQIDGTLAHAIERSFLFFIEVAGFKWIKIAAQTVVSTDWKGVLEVKEKGALDRIFTKVYRPLISSYTGGISTLEATNREIRGLSFFPSSSIRPRINLLVPSINPKETFGGIATALAMSREFWELYKDASDYRIIVTDATIAPDASAKFADFSFLDLDSFDDGGSKTIVPASARADKSLNLRCSDIFIATAWWTAVLGFNALDAQRSFFNGSNKLVYLIQDFEPNFYGWGSRWMLAENTYKRGNDTIAVINSEELCQFMESRYTFFKSFCLPYKINNHIKNYLKPQVVKKKQILIYGRPSVHRNGFELIVDGLFLWQQRYPYIAAEWKIVSLGEMYGGDWVQRLQNFSVVGKAELSQYAQYLSESAVGISLMFSPHPSYPPLEMAESGLVTITNLFEGKDLSRRSSNIISLTSVTKFSIADALEVAVANTDNSVDGGQDLGSRMTHPGFAGEYYSARKLLSGLRLPDF